MRVKNKKKLYALLLVLVGAFGYFIWLSWRPVEIIAVHEDGNYSSILVNTFPITAQGKIDWWLKNKDTLKLQYDIPKPASNGGFTTIIWRFREGYKEEGKHDRLCFTDMPPPVNCIEKDRVFSISFSKNRGTIFTVNDGEYRMEKNGDITKLKGQ